MNILSKCLSLALSFLAFTTSAQTKTLSRLIATSRFDYDGTAYKMSDTETFVYGIGRGGDDFYNLPYDYSLSLKARTPSSLDSSVRNEKTYNTANKVLTHKQQYYRNTALGWSNTTFISYTYDWRNNETEQKVQKWNDGTMAWENQDLLFKTYDANSNLITQITQEWNKTFGTWVNKNQFLNSYDTKNRITNIVYLLWDGTNWINNTQDSYFFDTKDNLVSKLNFKWNAGLGTWDSSGKTEMTFSSTNKRLSETISDYISGSWVAQRISETVYDSNDSIFLIENKDWKASTSKWSNQIKAYLRYNAAGQLIQENSLRGLNDTGWQNYSINYFEYDMAINSKTRTFSIWRDALNKYDTGTKITKVYNSYQQQTKYIWDFWDSSSKKFRPYEMSNYYYEEFTAGIKDVNSKNGSIVAFPIPASQYLNLEINWQEKQNFSVSIYDVSGRSISNWTLKNEKHYLEHFPLNNFPNGQFFIVVISEKGDKISKSFIVQK